MKQCLLYIIDFHLFQISIIYCTITSIDRLPKNFQSYHEMISLTIKKALLNTSNFDITNHFYSSLFSLSSSESLCISLPSNPSISFISASAKSDLPL